MARCPVCNSELPAETRWCPFCRRDVLYPEIGRLATPSRRLGAYLLDYFFGSILTLIVTFAERIGGNVGVVLSVTSLISFLIFVFVLLARGTTPGKMLLGMHVFRKNGERTGFFTMFIREGIAKSISGIVIGLGLLWILWDKENQGWHDKLMSTYVVQTHGN